MNEAARGGNVEVMKWLKARAGPSVQLIPECVLSGSMEWAVRRWLKENKCLYT